MNRRYLGIFNTTVKKIDKKPACTGSSSVWIKINAVAKPNFVFREWDLENKGEFPGGA